MHFPRPFFDMMLLPDTPRKIKTPFATAGVISMAALLLASPLLTVLAMTAPDTVKYRHLADRGVEGEAIITQLYDRSSRSGRRTRYASYHYTIDGRTYAADDRLPYEKGEDLKADARLRILYDPAEPGHSIVNRGVAVGDRYQQSLEHLEWAGGITGPFFLFGIVVIAFQYLKQRNLLKWGIATQATIVAEERCQNRNGESITLHYEFTDTTGTVYRGEKEGIPLPETAETIGRAKRQRMMTDPIALYHPRYPGVNALYPLDWVELRYEMPILSREVTL